MRTILSRRHQQATNRFLGAVCVTVANRLIVVVSAAAGKSAETAQQEPVVRPVRLACPVRPAYRVSPVLVAPLVSLAASDPVERVECLAAVAKRVAQARPEPVACLVDLELTA